MRLMPLVLALGAACTAPAVDGSAWRATGASAAPLVVETTGGLVQGVVVDDIRAFRGLPYAAPPVGDLRWRAPRPPVPWSGVRDASSFTPFCDLRVYPGFSIPFGEDCLYLNVYTPTHLGSRPLPVIVVLHGAGDTSFSAVGLHPTPPPRLATRGAMVVTVDWRSQTILSTFDHPALAAEHDGAGNFGLLDLFAALSWIKDNAGAFGGDPDRVLVSGGGYGIALLASPRSRGLFSAAAVEGAGRIVSKQPAEAEADGLAFAEAAGCTGPDAMACLRALTPEELLAVPAPPAGRWHVVVDGDVFTAPIYDAIAAGNVAAVPVLVGSARDEASGAGVYDPYEEPFSEEDYAAALHDHYDFLGVEGMVESLLALYPSADYGSPLKALIAADTDAIATCHMRIVALAATGVPGDPGPRRVWRWLMAHSYENDPELGYLGAHHKQMAHFVLGDFGDIYGKVYVPTAAEEELAARIQDTYIHFAATGDPNGGPLGAAWPRSFTSVERMLVIDDTTSIVENFHVPQCEFWTQHPW